VNDDLEGTSKEVVMAGNSHDLFYVTILPFAWKDRGKT
jgi:hypothetical protein